MKKTWLLFHAIAMPPQGFAEDLPWQVQVASTQAPSVAESAPEGDRDFSLRSMSKRLGKSQKDTMRHALQLQDLFTTVSTLSQGKKRRRHKTMISNQAPPEQIMTNSVSLAVTTESPLQQKILK